MYINAFIQYICTYVHIHECERSFDTNQLHYIVYEAMGHFLWLVWMSSSF